MYLNVENFSNQLSKLLPTFPKETFLLAVSGGVDSMVLASLFKDLNLKFEIAHVNYKLRAEDSDLDQKIVEDFCSSNTIKLHLRTASEADDKPDNSIQIWARELRYQFFNKIQSEQKLNYLITAHHLNDNLETFLINLSRASGRKGLAGIPVDKNNILRPLLKFSKEEIYRFAKENRIHFREDLSNQKNDYLRNEIRNNIVPQLTKIENFLENVSKTLSHLDQANSFIDQQIKVLEEVIISKKENYSEIDKQKFFEQTTFVQFEILRKFDFKNADEIKKISEAENGKSFYSKNFVLTTHRDLLIIKKISDLKKVESSEIILKVDENNCIIIPGKINVELKKLGSSQWRINLNQLKLPLKLRKRKSGDLFYPTGMTGKKKVGKFLRDEKAIIKATDQEWLLTDSEDKILGVLPFRQDRRFLSDAGYNSLTLDI